ncbi:LysM domain-containing protein [Bacteroidales bacterium OttesenSCG-928-I21]|nr:LysM domain-containing protein [Bacteroidales bacterium OttesenSCG-928-I21]
MDNIIYLKTLPRLEVINEQIYQVLDSLILYNENCVYTIHNKPYFFEINLKESKNDTICIKLSSKQYYVWMDYETNWIGYFYYKENLVMVKPSDIYFLFFKKTSDIKNIYYEKHIIYLRPYSKIYERMEIEYSYIDGVFIAGNKFLCQEASPYYYKIKDGDTWGKIMKDYGITEKNIISLNKRVKIKKAPHKGKTIRLY